MYVFLSILILVASVILILIVLVQNSKGGGLASTFSSSNQIMGVRKTTDFLEKATWGLAATVGILCIVITVFIPRNEVSNQPQSEIQQQVNEAVTVDPNLLNPNFGTAQPDVDAVPAELPEVPPGE
jgi:preprotein translocase subunit SecG